MKLRIAAALAALLASLGSVSVEGLTIRFGHPGTVLDNRQYSQGDATSYARAREPIEKEFRADKAIKVEWTYFRGASPALNEALRQNSSISSCSATCQQTLVARAGLSTSSYSPPRAMNRSISPCRSTAI
ncbi:hypothetical protein [Sinorhizobium meliloti]|uniref:hypothetical protein n=1 Tax=Rhizobium meliloti TaxID=382 RepID=UPI000FDAA14A|nr:hypothetical protein [Sinorhizobium meliloti]RVI62691.1 hypothetical protein CN189_18250 [Sinorhizobium meliloti]